MIMPLMTSFFMSNEVKSTVQKGHFKLIHSKKFLPMSLPWLKAIDLLGRLVLTRFPPSDVTVSLLLLLLLLLICGIYSSLYIESSLGLLSAAKLTNHPNNYSMDYHFNINILFVPFLADDSKFDKIVVESLPINQYS